MSETAPLKVIYQAAGEAPATWALGSLFERVLTGGQCGGAFDISLVTQPPGTATPLHRHTREAEVFYLLAGSMSYRAGEEIFHLTAGDFIYLQRCARTFPAPRSHRPHAGLLDQRDLAGRHGSKNLQG